MDSVEERIALAESFTHFLRGIKELDDYIKTTSQYFDVPLNITDMKHSLLVWQEHLEINKEISQKRKFLAEIVDEGIDIIKRRHPESAYVQAYMDSKEDDLRKLELACEEQMRQQEVYIISCLEKKHSYRRVEGGNSESRVADDQIPISVDDIGTSKLAAKLREIFEESWENYQPLALLEIEKLLLKPLRLHTAVLCGAYDEVERLCKITEEIEQRDFLGRSALHLAVFCTVTQKEADVAMNILNLLLIGGFNPWEPDDLMGLNCFEYAARIKAFPALNLLLAETGEERSNIKVDFQELVPASLAGEHLNVLKCCSAETIKKNAGAFILEMCEKGNVNVLNYTIENFDVFDHLNQVDEYHNTLLHRACAKQHFNILESLLGCGLRVDAVNVIGKTALHVASEVPAVECVAVLLKHGSDVLAKDNEGRTPLYLGRRHADVLDLLTASSNNANYNRLHLAAYSGNVEYVRNLIEDYLDVNSLSVENETVLHIAAEIGNDEMMELLAGKVADLNVRNNQGLTALHLALYKGHVKCAEVLINKGADVECEDKKQNQPLHLAARFGHDSILKLLLTKGAKICCTNINDQSPLHLACHYSNFDCVGTLLRSGAYVNSRDKWGNYPLYLAAKNGDGKVLNLLCEKGADINGENLRKQTALHRASEQGNLVWVRGLLKRQANITCDEDSCTPLVLAAKNGHHDVMKLLLKKKSNVPNERYDIAMELACVHGYLACVKVLVSNGVILNSFDRHIFFHVAALREHREVIAYLISEGWNINEVGFRKESALHAAIVHGHTQSVQILIENGADVDAEHASGFKPFHLATVYGKCNVMKLLLRNGVQVNCTGEHNRSALHFAALARHSGQAVQLLLESGANINLQDEHGHTPMHLAFIKENTEVINILKQHGAHMDIRNRNGLRPCEMPVQRHMFFSDENIAAQHQFFNHLMRTSLFFQGMQ